MEIWKKKCKGIYIRIKEAEEVRDYGYKGSNSSRG